MARFYYLQIILGNISIDDVPSKWKETVEALMEE